MNYNSIKSIAVKKNTTIKAATRFIKGKMLMFPKVPYKVLCTMYFDVFCFPSKEIKEIYQQNAIIKCFVYLFLADADSWSLQFIFVCKLNSTISEKESRFNFPNNATIKAKTEIRCFR